MSSLDDLVDQLLEQHQSQSVAAASPSAARPAAAAGPDTADQFEQLIKNAAGHVAAQTSAETEAEVAQLRGQLQLQHKELESLRAENQSLRQQASEPKPAETLKPGDILMAPTSGGSGTFPWKKHIGTVEDSVRKKQIAVAEPLIKALVDVADFVGSEPSVRVRLMTQLGTIYVDSAREVEAAELLSKAITLVPQSEGMTNADKLARAFCLDAMAQCCQQKEDFERAEKLRREAVAISEDALGGEHPDVGFFRERLENLRQERQLAMIGGDEASKTILDKLTEEYNAAVAEGKDVSVPESKPADGYSGFMFEKFMGMAKTAIAQKNQREAESALRSALEKSDGVADTDPRKCEVMRLYAKCLEQQGKDNEARELYGKALTIAFKFLGWKNLEVAYCLSALADVNSKLNDVGLAKNYYKQAASTYALILGKDDEATQLAQQCYAEFIDRMKAERKWKDWAV